VILLKEFFYRSNVNVLSKRMSINVLVIFRVMVNVAAKKVKRSKKKKFRHLKKKIFRQEID
jgi:L-cystine uptake protein TcyP (sodium:dicarboxylate symporter family)